MHIFTTILLPDEFGDPVEHDVKVTFRAECVSPGYAATRTDPGEGPELECHFEDAELDSKTGKLTAAEFHTVKTYFAANPDKAIEAANDNFEPYTPDPDDARFDYRGRRGLAA
jgi:hypothetical protein